MKYLSAYYWQQEDKNSLVLKHLVYRKNNFPVVFGCISDDTHYNSLLTEWFYQKGLRGCKKENQTEGSLADSLSKALATCDEGYGEENLPDTAGILCADHQFVLWKRGNFEIDLLCTRFGRPLAKKILQENQEDSLLVLNGVLEEGVGLLIMNSRMYEHYTDRELQECLNVKDLCGEERMQKRLKELGEEAKEKAKEKGGQQPAALLVVSC